MEGVLLELTVGSGVLLAAVALLMLAAGGILLGYLSEQEKVGKRFFWTESSLPEPELANFLPSGVGMRRAA